MITVKYNATFRLLPFAHADGTHTVRMIVTWKGQRLLHCLPVSVYEDQWDDDAMFARPTKAHKNTKNINEVIFYFRDKVTDIFQKASSDDHIPTKEEVKSALTITLMQDEEPEEDIVNDTEGGVESQETDNKEDSIELHPIPKTITEFVIKQTEDRGWSSVTANKFYNLRHDLLCAGLKNVEDLNGEGIEKFLAYLRTRNLENAVFMKKASVLRWFLGWCRKKGYLDNDEYKLHQPHLKCPKKEVIYLEWDELMQMLYFDYGKYTKLSNIRDVFCFCAFTGLRYCDAKKMKWRDIHSDHIRIVTQKTRDALRIELNKYSRLILDKYRVEGVSSPDRLVLPAVSNQKANEYLKEAAMLAQIDEPLTLMSYKGSKRIETGVLKWEAMTTHCARRTFVVNSLRLGIPAEVIMKWTGHSDFTAMKPYIAIVDELKRENMARYDEI